MGSINYHVGDITKLEEYRNYLVSAGADAQMSMDDKERPGLLVAFEGLREVFITFIEGGESEPEIMRIAAETATDGEASYPEDLGYVSLLISADEADGPERLKEFIRLLLSGKSLEVYPTAEQLTVDEEKESALEGLDYEETSDDEPIDPDLSDSATMLVPRINALTGAVIREGADDAQAGIAGIAFTIVVDDGLPFVAAFESTSENEYLLHFRTDIPYGEDEQGEMEELVKVFNDKSLFTRCSLGKRDLGLFDDEAPLVVTFHAVTVDNGPVKDDSFYGFFASLFENEVGQFMDELFTEEEE